VQHRVDLAVDKEFVAENSVGIEQIKPEQIDVIETLRRGFIAATDSLPFDLLLD